MIDIHIIKHPSENRDITSLVDSLSVDSRINAIVVEGFKDNIGKGRFAGFSISESPYVSFIDDDDEIDMDELTACLDYIESGKSNNYAFSTREKINGKEQFYDINPGEIFCKSDLKFMHHMVICSKSLIKPYLKYLPRIPNRCEISLWAMMINDGVKFEHLGFTPYNWVPGEAHRSIPPTKSTWEILNVLTSISKKFPEEQRAIKLEDSSTDKKHIYDPHLDGAIFLEKDSNYIIDGLLIYETTKNIDFKLEGPTLSDISISINNNHLHGFAMTKDYSGPLDFKFSGGKFKKGSWLTVKRV